MVSIPQALRQIKQSPHAILEPTLIESVCSELGLEWRQTELAPPVTIAWFIRQVIEGNVSCAALRQIAGGAFSASAYCQARARLPLEVLREYSQRVYDAAQQRCQGRPEDLWHGHRTWYVDSSSFSMPDTPELQEHFGQPGQQEPGCGFPVAHLFVLFDARTGLMRQGIASPLRTHDMSKASLVHEYLGREDIVVGDTALGSYAHFALLLQAGLHGLFPARQLRIVDFTPHRPYVRPGSNNPTKGMTRSRWIRSLGKFDQLVEWFKPPNKPQWISPAEYDALPESIVVRETRGVIRRKGFRPITVTVVSTLLDEKKYPAEDLIELRRQRWNVETDLRHLKTTMKMEVLRCQSVEGVLKELAVFILVYNLVRVVMMEAADEQQVALDRVSFADALYWIRHCPAGDRMPRLMINPTRPNRVEPRAIKRRPKEYDRLNKPRDQMRLALINQMKTA